MRTRMTTLLLALAGLLVAVAVGLAANAIASRSFTPGVDALPSAGSLAPPRPTTPASRAGDDCEAGDDAEACHDDAETCDHAETGDDAGHDHAEATTRAARRRLSGKGSDDDSSGKGKGSDDDSSGKGSSGSDD